MLRVSPLLRPAVFLLCLPLLACGAEPAAAPPAPAAQPPQATAPARPPDAPLCPILHVSDGDTVALLLGGRRVKVRLIGIDTPERERDGQPAEPHGEEAALFMENLLLGESVWLEYEPAQPRLDVHGRTLAYLYRAPDGLFVNLEIARQGYGEAEPQFPSRYMTLFLDAQKKARQAEKGIWSPSLPAAAGRPLAPRAGPAPPAAPAEAAPPPVPAASGWSAEEAARHAGETGTVCGTVVDASWVRSTKGEPTFLNFGRPHPEESFTVLIWGDDRAAFGEPEKDYLGKRICVAGKVSLHKGRPEIVVGKPAQLQVQP